ncbi:MAG: MATE family efflux transporter, partial [Erysipelotrichaceae bacterium]|nr:MATE family efflux transporter [Erysipelotrichaceae bacterium]
MKESNFTEGSILGPLMKFAVPVILAMILQSLYGAVDLWVVGQFASSADVSAVATGTQIMHTLTSIVAGLSMGTTILIGQQIGEGNREGAGKSMGASVVFFAIVAVLLSVVFVSNVSFIVTTMKAPIEAFDMTCDYVRICSVGLLFIVAYNLLGSLFRGMGNSRLPLISVMIAAIFNVFGDLYFVNVLHLGAAGAAYATVLAQALSVGISFVIILKTKLPFTFRKSYLRFDKEITGKVLNFGFPLALSDALVGVSFLMITAIVNSLGLVESAGVGVAEKVCAFIMLIPSAFSHSTAAFVAQNYGANKLDRADKGLVYGIGVSFAVSCVMAWLSFAHGDLLCSIFSIDPLVINAGWEYLKAYALDCFLTSIFFCMNGYFNGCG